MFAQEPVQEIVGVVLDRDSSGVPSASLALFPGAVVAVTDERGRFRFTSLAAGTYRLVTRKLGYQPDTSAITVGSAGRTEIRVVLQVTTLLRVTVTAARSGLPKVADRDRRGLGAVMYADEIAKSPLYSTLDILKFSSRFQIGNRTNIRHREQIFVDGRPVYSEEDIPDKRDIAAIEAHRGYMGLRNADLWIPINQSPISSARIVLIWTVQYMEQEGKRLSSP